MSDVFSAGGRDAAEIARLFWVMAAGALAIWIVVTTLALHAMRRRRSPWSQRSAVRLIVIGGCAIPAILLAALMAYGMPLLARHAERAADLRITVIGEQWWWRVRYQLPNGQSVDLANEIRLPRRRIAQIELTSTNVIHSFWIPALAGKVDMIPGRVTRLTLEPSRAGIYRGLCAEYCGASHARMAFVAEVMEVDAFAAWLEHEARPAASSDQAFEAHGCAACHAIRGTLARATIGPDLTHVGRRHSIAAGATRNDAAAIAEWIARPDQFKPGALMPRFDALPLDQRLRLADYL
ncbi:MAG TPA: cytochrome c oxidase subunit II, partial [Vicinamibacterales bacterium]|nr:cytochrome c oxidase subunit II [Vicinamibacterales bacterium]